ncbi:SDR family NAD(P)-dependent oxidoreductase [Zavarzinia sp. CC-PAN008]|uniref:SDR family NAD(P)-dependent oxidoreductase n=1 Tax=Zavarzinia sp. CC-PAN008 TaxID=3243332 RepID=UPI003F743987
MAQVSTGPAAGGGRGRLAGRTVLVAGGAGGIGSAICTVFAAEGALVVCGDPALERSTALVEAIRAAGGRACHASLDAGVEESWNQAVALAVREGGRLDGLVNATYSGRAGTFASMTQKGWERSFAVTSTGVFLGMKAAVPAMDAGGAIVNLSSAAAHGPAPGNIGYAAAKAAMISTSRSAAAELAPQGIRVNVVTPGTIQTPALDATMEVLGKGAGPDKPLAAFLRRIPMARVGQPEEIAKACLFLISDEASYVTGAELVVDGGLLCGG